MQQHQDLEEVVEGMGEEIDFGLAHPPLECLPVFLTRCAFQGLGRDEAFSTQLGELLSYNEYQGTGNFRITFTNLFNQYYPKATIYGRNVMILPGASFAIHFICSHLKEKREGGQVVIVEDPSYSLVYDIFYNLGLEIKGIPVDHEGLNVDLLEEELKSGLKIKFVYSIPVFHNPTGVSLSQQRRTKLIGLSKKYNFYIISDEVYSLLSFQSPLIIPLSCEDYEPYTVCSVGSFSKIFAPGLRVGWIIAFGELMNTLSNSPILVSGGGFSALEGAILQVLIKNNSFSKHLSQVLEIYHKKHQIIWNELKDCTKLEFTPVQGGFFLWIKVKEDAESFFMKLKKEKVRVIRGNSLSINSNYANYFRICFTNSTEEDTTKACKMIKNIVS